MAAIQFITSCFEAFISKHIFRNTSFETFVRNISFLHHNNTTSNFGSMSFHRNALHRMDFHRMTVHRKPDHRKQVHRTTFHIKLRQLKLMQKLS